MKPEDTVDLEDRSRPDRGLPKGRRPASITQPVGTPGPGAAPGLDTEISGENTAEEFTDTSQALPEDKRPTMFPEDTGPVVMARGRLGPAEVSRIVALHIPRRDPFTRWYYGMPVDQRLSVYRAFWMLAASFFVVGTFTFCLIFLYPKLSNHFLPQVGPRPSLPQFFHPPSGQLFALVEHRGYDRDRFMAGLDCIWLTYDPARAPKLAKEGPYLERRGLVVARLDVKENWDGLLRLYFSEGDLRTVPEAELVLPLEGGGAFLLAEQGAAKVLLPGAPSPDRLVVGQVRFFSR